MTTRRAPASRAARRAAPSSRVCTPYTPGASMPGDRRAHRHAARGVDEVVERLVVLPAGLELAGAHGAGVQVDRRGLGADPHVDVVAAVLLGRPRDELRLPLDGAADPVGDAARGVGRGATPLERDDPQLVRAAPLARLARGAHARRVAADDHQPPLAHGRTVAADRSRGGRRPIRKAFRRQERVTEVNVSALSTKARVPSVASRTRAGLAAGRERLGPHQTRADRLTVVVVNPQWGLLG